MSTPIYIDGKLVARDHTTRQPPTLPEPELTRGVCNCCGGDCQESHHLWCSAFCRKQHRRRLCTC